MLPIGSIYWTTTVLLPKKNSNKPTVSKVVSITPGTKEADPEKGIAEIYQSTTLSSKSDAIDRKNLWVRHWKNKKNIWFHDFTKEHFFCRGSPRNTFKEVQDEEATSYYTDCMGGRIGHGLALYEGKPWFSSTIIQVCNALQEQELSFSIIEGHCCDEHLSYHDPKHLRTDRHIMGAAATIHMHSPLSEQELCLFFQKASDHEPLCTQASDEVRKGYRHAYKNSTIRIDCKKDRSDNWIVRIESLKEQGKRLQFNWSAYTQFQRY